MLKKLIKANMDDKKALNKLIDEFVKINSKKPVESLEEFLKELTIFIYKRYDKIDKELLKTLAIDRLKELNIAFDLSSIDTIYSKMLEASAIVAAGALQIKPKPKIVFDRVDIDAIKAMRESFFWVRDEYNDKITEQIKDVLEDVFNGKIPRAKLPKILQERYGDILKRDIKYFEGVADHMINQAQNIARVSQAAKYGIKWFRVVARIDGKTSNICRSMNGRIISVEHLTAQAQEIINARSIGEKKAAAEWKSGYFFGELPKNFGLPPYHFRCRTMIQAVNLKKEEFGGKRVIYSSKDDGDVLTCIDKIGVERHLNREVYNKLKYKHNLSDKEIVGALKSIKEIAPHNEDSRRFVAKSANGCIIVFESDKIVSMFKPTNKRGKANLDEYFKNHSKYDKKEVIKWKKQENLLLRLIKALIGR